MQSSSVTSHSELLDVKETQIVTNCRGIIFCLSRLDVGESWAGAKTGSSKWVNLDPKMHVPAPAHPRHRDDFVPDHNHLMHFYRILWPGMDVDFDLHPDPTGTGEFRLTLPTGPARTYHLYADVVQGAGFPETLVASLGLSDTSGRQLAGDQAEGTAPKFDPYASDPPPQMAAEMISCRRPSGPGFALRMRPDHAVG
jgi:hypothetical protein